MSLIARFAAFALLSLTPALAHAAAHDEDADDGDSDSEPAPSTPTEAPRGEAVAVTGLVPLQELNRRPYEGVWFADFRLHNYVIGLSVEQVHLDITTPITLIANGVSTPSTSTDSGRIDFAGAFGNYWLPLLGYSTELSAGLLPGIKLQVGGTYSGSGDSSDGIKTALDLPIFAMVRLGHHASRYARWPFSLGAGAGFDLVHFGGGPDSSSQTYVAPDLRLEVGYGFFQLGYETQLGSHATSLDAHTTLAYSTSVFTLGVLVQPEPDE